MHKIFRLQSGVSESCPFLGQSLGLSGLETLTLIYGSSETSPERMELSEMPRQLRLYSLKRRVTCSDSGVRMKGTSCCSCESDALGFCCTVLLGQRVATDTVCSLCCCFSCSSLTPSNCPILDDKELHEAHPWFEFLVQCRGVASNPRGRAVLRP